MKDLFRLSDVTRRKHLNTVIFQRLDILLPVWKAYREASQIKRLNNAHYY